MAQKALWGWYPAGNVWVKLQVAATGKLVIDPTALFEEPPTNGEMGKAATSNWSFDHNANVNAHHDRQHVISAAADHTGRIALSQMTDGAANLVLTAQGAGSDPVYAAAGGGYTQGARAYHNAAQGVPSITWTVLALNSEQYDTDSIHDNGINNSRLTCKTAGKYIIVGNAEFVVNGAGGRALAIWLNNTTFIALVVYPSTDAFGEALCVSTIWSLAVNDYVELRAYQSSGGALNVSALSAWSPQFMMQRIG